MEADTLTHKRCSRCNGYKPTTEYSTDKKRKDGLYSYCKPCSSGVNKAWRDKGRKTVVYVIEHPTELGYVKIGMTVDPRQKLADYNYASPNALFKFHAVYEVDNPHLVERRILEHFRDKRPVNKAGVQGAKPRDWIKIDVRELTYFIESVIPQEGTSHATDTY